MIVVKVVGKHISARSWHTSRDRILCRFFVGSNRLGRLLLFIPGCVVQSITANSAQDWAGGHG